MQVESLDRWQWRPDPAMGYSVHDAYQILTSQDSVTLGEAEDLLWHKQVFLKVSIFAWRLLRNRLPAKTNLVSRGILALDLYDCVDDCGGIETARYLFLSCSTFGSLWARWMPTASLITHLFSWWHSCSAVISTGRLACLCLGSVE
ncbi:hypothetical protein QL285_091290 [Trifolium repens]|nr:hypothetical protein QL285_091290 [Trifolium repens]